MTHTLDALPSAAIHVISHQAAGHDRSAQAHYETHGHGSRPAGAASAAPAEVKSQAQRPLLLGVRRSHSETFRRGGRATMSPPRDRPVSCTRRRVAVSGPEAGRILMSPLPRSRSSASTTIPGLVTRVRFPPMRRSTSMCRVRWVITALAHPSGQAPSQSPADQEMGLPRGALGIRSGRPACVRATASVRSTAVHGHPPPIGGGEAAAQPTERVVLDAILLIRRGRADRRGVGFAQHGPAGGGAHDG